MGGMGRSGVDGVGRGGPPDDLAMREQAGSRNGEEPQFAPGGDSLRAPGGSAEGGFSGQVPHQEVPSSVLKWFGMYAEGSTGGGGVAGRLGMGGGG